MPNNTQTQPEKPHHEFSFTDASNRTMTCRAAFVEKLPMVLTYTANLEPPDRAVLFYDNLVAAAEYFCAFIEEGIRRREVTCFTGLEPTRYRSLFEQVGIRVAELENCGYLRNLSTYDFCQEIKQPNDDAPGRDSNDPLRIGLDDNPREPRLIRIHNARDQQNNSLQDMMEEERRVHKLSSYQTTSICCYDAKLVIEDAPPEFFTELLKAHDHCLFQGIAMPTSKLLALRTNEVYPRVRSG